MNRKNASDKFDRLIKTEYNDGTKVHYEYNADGFLANLTHKNAMLGVYTFAYDSLGKLIRMEQADGRYKNHPADGAPVRHGEPPELSELGG